MQVSPKIRYQKRSCDGSGTTSRDPRYRRGTTDRVNVIGIAFALCRRTGARNVLLYSVFVATCDQLPGLVSLNGYWTGSPLRSQTLVRFFDI